MFDTFGSIGISEKEGKELLFFPECIENYTQQSYCKG